jgi:RHS repeat-associated protein
MQNFNVENELAGVVVGSNTTSFTYDAVGIRVKTVHPGGKTSYFPFPGYEEEVNGSTSRCHPFGGFRTTPTAGLTDVGFTGHRHNNIGTGDLGLVYMGARFYLPGVGRFLSADVLVPDPTNPQQFNRYSYVLNNALRYTDPSGRYCYDPSFGDAAGQCYTDSGQLLNPPPPRPPVPIWTRSFINEPDWVQYYGHTNFSKSHPYNTDGGQHPGLDYGKFAQSFGGTWNRETRRWDFDGTYGTPESPLFPVYAGCYCQVDSTSIGSPYAPGRVNLTH